MNKILISIVIMGLMVASVFGFAGMTHLNMNCSPGSPDSTCPPTQIGMALHHLFSYEGFTIAIISPTVATIISTLLALVLVFVFVQIQVNRESSALVRIRSGDNSEPQLRQKIKISRWLSLFENSPSLILQH